MKFRKTLKRITFILIVALFASFCIAGCGQKSISFDDETEESSEMAKEETSSAKETTTAETTTAETTSAQETTEQNTEAITEETTQGGGSNPEPDRSTEPPSESDTTKETETSKSTQPTTPKEPETTKQQETTAKEAETSKSAQPSTQEPTTQEPTTQEPTTPEPTTPEPTAPEPTTPEQTTPETKLTTCHVTVDGGGDAGVFYSGYISFEGDLSVFDLLVKTGVSYDGNSTYVKAINGLREKEHGPMSGWLYQVNGKTPMISCGAYFPNDGDEIYWWYQYDE